MNIAGEDAVAIGSDFDGAILPPSNLRSCLDYPNLVEQMLKRGYRAERIKKIMGGNFLRALRDLRG